jgi:acetolactate synthase I/II/III large subunit
MDTKSTKSHSSAHYFLEALNEVGIDYLFCNFGTDHAPIIEELARWTSHNRPAPRIVLCPHENVAMHMAAGYALMTGRGQGVLVHVDAGTANASMAMHNLHRARIPVMLIAGTAPFTTRGELVGSRDTYVHFVQQPMDQGSLVRPYTKWEYTLPSGVVAKEALRRAHTIMESEPKGPVYLMLPRETLTQTWDEDKIVSFPADRFGPLEASGADPRLVEALADRVLNAVNPILITSYAGRDAAASDAIEKLAAFTGIRVIDFLSTNNISHESTLFGGYQPDRLADADLGLLVDVEVPWLPKFTAENPATYWAQIDVDVLKTASPMWSFPANLRLQGRSSRILTQLLEILGRRATPQFRSRAQARVDQLTQERQAQRETYRKLSAAKGSSGQINVHYVCAELAKVIGPDDIVVNEAVTNQAVPVMHIPRPNPATMISNPGGGLGMSGGLALGVKLARPRATVVQIVGDGSFYFTNPIAVVAVAKQHQLPIFTVVLDNSGWSAVKGSVLRVYSDGEARNRNEFQALLPSGMDFAQVAVAAGGYGEKVVEPADVPGAIQRCLAAAHGGHAALMHVCITRL